MRNLLALLALVTVCGCQTGTLADPNDPTEAGMMAPDVIRRQLKGTSDSLMERVSKGELTDDEFKQLIEKRAKELLSDLPTDQIDPARAWEYGEVFRTAKRWDQAKKVLEIAVKHAEDIHNEDRRVNDVLRLAHAEAMLGQIPESLKTAEQVMNAEPNASAPILPGILLELTPAIEGKKHDPELAKLLEQAIDKHMKTQVDIHSDAGKVFIMARPHHVRNAWRKIVELYAKAGMDAEARAALQRGDDMMSSMRRV